MIDIRIVVKGNNMNSTPDNQKSSSKPLNPVVVDKEALKKLVEKRTKSFLRTTAARENFLDKLIKNELNSAFEIRSSNMTELQKTVRTTVEDALQPLIKSYLQEHVIPRFEEAVKNRILENKERIAKTWTNSITEGVEYAITESLRGKKDLIVSMITSTFLDTESSALQDLVSLIDIQSIIDETLKQEV